VGAVRVGVDRQRRALRLIGGAFLALAAYLAVQSVLVLVTGYRPGHSVLGVSWTAVTAAAMFALAVGKARAGRALGNPVRPVSSRPGPGAESARPTATSTRADRDAGTTAGASPS
jgi:hypothetical protein